MNNQSNPEATATEAQAKAAQESTLAIQAATFEPGTPYYDQEKDQKRAACEVTMAQDRADNAQKCAEEADEQANDAERLLDEAEGLLQDLEAQVEGRRQAAEEARRRANAAQSWADQAAEAARKAATALGAYTAQILAGGSPDGAKSCANAATGNNTATAGFYNAVEHWTEQAQMAADEAYTDRQDAEEAADTVRDDSDELGSLLNR